MNTIHERTPDYSKLPERMWGAIYRYIEHGIPPGHFLSAVICNDLREACARADDENRSLLFEYVRFFHCYAPISCWGSEGKFVEWVKRRGLKGSEDAANE